MVTSPRVVPTSVVKRLSAEIADLWAGRNVRQPMGWAGWRDGPGPSDQAAGPSPSSARACSRLAQAETMAGRRWNEAIPAGVTVHWRRAATP